MDTIRADIRRPLHPEVAAALSNSSSHQRELINWEFTYRARHPTQARQNAYSSITAEHIATSIRASIWGGEVKRVTCSLPAVLHGTNGICLKYDELDGAIRRVREILGEISQDDIAPWDLLRWDFAIQIRCDVPQVISQYRDAKPKGINAAGKIYVCEATRLPESIQWCGKDLSVILYDKGSQLNSKRGKKLYPIGHVLRIEVSLKTRSAIRKFLPEFLSNFWGTRGTYPIPYYFVAWRIFREAVCSLEPKVKLDIGSFKIEGLLAECEAANLILSNGMRALEWYGQNRNPDTVRKLRKRVQALKRPIRNWDFNKVLPKGFPPDMVDLLLSGDVVDVPCPFREPS
ncbi:hypothetical protein [Verrucomicrobium sp. BvORR034]|uniref:hypothetical protein n=1 Tax=Verrucomicrobium sp. BvORR034 TaxID=1396418 RepID=UPI002240ED3B|nr:hypothetical protein [Verrucomicrobium sp. BvORR034]